MNRNLYLKIRLLIRNLSDVPSATALKKMRKALEIQNRKEERIALQPIEIILKNNLKIEGLTVQRDALLPIAKKATP